MSEPAATLIGSQRELFEIPNDAGGVPAGLAERLARALVYVSVRGDSIRAAPHLYNDARDIERFVTLLREALR